MGVSDVLVFVKGVGPGRETAIKSLEGLNITLIRDRTHVPRNGCRPPKVRRV